MKRLSLDPDERVSPNGAPFICHGCHQFSIVINDGKSLRKPTLEEAHQFAPAQAQANQLPSGSLSSSELDAIVADIRRRNRRH
jgi:hypothetical protein